MVSARSGGALEVLDPGALTTVQDLGRPGHAHLGVPRSGALDEPAHRLANRLVGTAETAATLETTLTGCSVRVHERCTAVVTGAPCPVTVDSRPAPWGTPVRLAAGSVLRVGAAARGVRSYVGFSGGVDAEPVLGSRATDLLSGLGPSPLRAGDRLALGATGAPGRAAPAVDAAPWQAPPRELVLPVHLGPRADWFTERARQHPADRGVPGVPRQQPHRPANGRSAAGTGRRAANCPVRACRQGRCRCPRRAVRCSSSPIIR